MKKLGAVLFILISIRSFSQVISGICMTEDSMPLSFVTVLNLKTQAKSFTDADGKFTIESEAASADTILFSHIGYEQIKLTQTQVRDLRSPIELKLINYQLQEVVVKPLDAKGILTEALANVSANYPADFTMSHVIYEDYWKMDDSAKLYYYFDYDMYLPGYMLRDSQQVYSTDIRHSMYTYDGRYIPGKNLGLLGTLLKQIYPENILDFSQIDEKSLSILSTSAVIDSEDYIVIRFRKKPVKFAKQVIIEGTVYINKVDKGILFAETHVFIEHPTHVKVVAKVDMLNKNQKVAFRKIDGKYVLDYVTSSSSNEEKILGVHTRQSRSASIRVLERRMKLKMDEIKMKKEVDDILTHEKPMDIKNMSGYHSTNE